MAPQKYQSRNNNVETVSQRMVSGQHGPNRGLTSERATDSPAIPPQISIVTPGYI